MEGGKQAWQNAKDYVTGTGTGLISQFGFDMPRVVAADVLNHPDILPYNYARTKSAGETSGIFGVTEFWVCFNPQGGPAAVSEQTVFTKYGTDGLTSVSVEGTIAGLAIFDNTAYTLTTSRWTNAAAKWVSVTNDLLTNAQVFVGPGVLNSSP